MLSNYMRSRIKRVCLKCDGLYTFCPHDEGFVWANTKRWAREAAARTLIAAEFDSTWLRLDADDRKAIATLLPPQ